MWDRWCIIYLSSSKARLMFSGCLDLVKSNENILNEEFEFNIT